MKQLLGILTFSIVLLASPFCANAQCAMCKATVEKSEGGQATFKERAKGLNTGILYLMCIPYLLAGIIGYYWYKNSKAERDRKDKVQGIIRSKVSKV